MATTIPNLIYRLPEFWAAPPTQDAVKPMGAWGRDLEKGPHTQVGGDMYWTSNGDAQVPLRTQGSGNVGADIPNAVTFSKTEGGVRYVPKASRYWSIYRMHRDAQRLIQNAPDVSEDRAAKGLMRKLNFTRRNWFRSVANYWWRDGRGGCATITAGAATATVTLASPSQCHGFEIGDVVVGYDPAVYDAAQPGVLSAVRAGSVTITAINRRTGALTFSANYNVGVTGGANGDVIGHLVYRQPGADPDGFTASLYGFGTWCAMRPADTTVTALGVNRATDPYRHGGYFAQLPLGTPTRGAIDEMLRLSFEFGIPIDRIYAPSSAQTDISNDLVNQTRTAYDEKRMRFGAAGAVAQGLNGEDVVVTTDPYLYDLRSNAKVFVGLVSNMWGYVTDAQGVGWSMEGAPVFEGAPFIRDSAGNLQADYGGVGNLICADPSSVITIYCGA
jgi:hypothetical protein